MNRRNFIRGATGLAALAVAGPTLAALSQTDRERLIQQIRSGLVEDQVFVLDEGGPIVIAGINELIIRRCRFVWKDRKPRYFIEMSKSSHVRIESCIFDASQTITETSSPKNGEVFWVGRHSQL